MSTGPQPLNDVFKHTEEKMQKALEATRIEFTSIRTGRATPALLDRIHCDAYGASVPLKQVATVTAPDARTLQIVAFDRATVGAIRKAIETSDLGLSPNVDGQTIRLGDPAAERGAPPRSRQDRAQEGGGRPRRRSQRSPQDDR